MLWQQQTWEVQCVARVFLKEVAISSTIEPPVGDSQTGEQLYQRSSHTAVGVLGPMTDFTTWEYSKWTENPQGIWLWKSAGFNCRTSTELRKQTLGGHKQNLVYTRIQEKGAVSPQETEPDLPVCAWGSLVKAWVDSGLLQGQQPWLRQSWEAQCVEGGCHYCHCPYHRLASGQTTPKEHSPTHQQKRNN